MHAMSKPCQKAPKHHSRPTATNLFGGEAVSKTQAPCPRACAQKQKTIEPCVGAKNLKQRPRLKCNKKMQEERLEARRRRQVARPALSKKT